MRAPALIFASFALAACAGTPPPPPPGDPLGHTVHRFHLPGPGSVNSYWIAVPDGAIVIDGQRLRSAARQLVAGIKVTGAEIAALLITHAHPDHIGGADAVITAAPSRSPILASGGTLETLADDPGGLLEAGRREFGGDFGGKLPGARRLRSGERVELGGILFETRELGVGEAPTMTLYYPLDSDVLFCGDLVASGMTPSLLEGHTAEWIEQLEALPTMYPRVRTLYPGHGAPGPIEDLVGDQLAYLNDFRARVAETLADDGRMSQPEREEIVRATEAAHPGFEPAAAVADPIGLNADAVAAELVGGF